MKAKYFIPCIIALAFSASCADEGDDINNNATNVSQNEQNNTNNNSDDNTNDNTNDNTDKDNSNDVDNEANYPVDKVQEIKVTRNINQDIVEEIFYQVLLSSKYDNISGISIAEVGYVYSQYDSKPVAGGDYCYQIDKKDISFNAINNKDITFQGIVSKLNQNTKYYMRSFLVTTQNDTIYNQRILEVSTPQFPEDVWLRRKDASFNGRFDCIQFYVDDQIYIYGGRDASTCYNDLWTYDKKSDTWKQMKSFLDTDNPRYAGVTKRSNGAAFIYKTKNDKLVFIGGGELSNGQPTASVFYYSTLNNRYATAGDHPNFSEKVPLFDEKGNPVYITIKGKAVYQKDMDQYPKYKTDENGNPTDEIEDDIWVDSATKKPKQFTVNASDGSVADLPQPLKGLVGFSLYGIVGECHYLGLGKNDYGTPVSICYEYLMRNDRPNTNDPNIPNRVLTWTESTFSIKGQRTGENLYEPICIEARGIDEKQGENEKVIIGTGENENGVSKNFYQIQMLTDRSVDVQPLPAVPEGFVARANATAFYLNFTKKDGTHINRMYVGTGRNCKEVSTTTSSLLNDFWCYDFNTSTWMPRANCSNIYRQGACGFAFDKTDDYFANPLEDKQRGMVSFGEGFVSGSGETNMTTLNDNWEYLP